MYLNNEKLLTTKKLTQIALFFSFAIFFSFFSKQLELSIFPTVGFLKLEFVLFVYLIAYKVVGNWTYFIIFFNSIFRMVYTADDIISVFSLILAGFIFTFLYSIFELIFLNVLHKNKNKNIISAIFAITNSVVWSSLLMCANNYYFLLDWYSSYYMTNFSEFKKVIIPIFLPFNLISFGLNGLLYLSLFRIIKYIKN